MSLSFFKSCALTLMLAVTFAVLSSAARGQAGVSQTCAQLGFKPGTKGHTDCVNQNSGVGGNKAAPKPANPAPAVKAPVVPVITAEQREDKFWDAAMAAGNKDGFEAYLERYPSGRYVSMAKVNIARLSPVSAPSVAARTTSRQPGTLFKDCPDCPEMVVVPAGQFVMGASSGEEERENLPKELQKKIVLYFVGSGELEEIYREEVVPGFRLHGLGDEAEVYVATTLERFLNPYLEHRLADIAGNHAEKVVRRIIGFQEWCPGVAMPRLSAIARR